MSLFLLIIVTACRYTLKHWLLSILQICIVLHYNLETALLHITVLYKLNSTSICQEIGIQSTNMKYTSLKARVVHKNYCYFVMCAAIQAQGPGWLPDCPWSIGKYGEFIFQNLSRHWIFFFTRRIWTKFLNGEWIVLLKLKLWNLYFTVRCDFMGLRQLHRTSGKKVQNIKNFIIMWVHISKSKKAGLEYSACKFITKWRIK
jgi:hypothetical protein